MLSISHYHTLATIDPTILRAYDIRGMVDDQLTVHVVYTLGLALGAEAIALNNNTIVCGRDGRLSSPTLSQALQQGLIESGCRVIDVGMVPTPVLYFAAQHLQLRAAIILTGSHNPSNYNGMKIILNSLSITADMLQQLYHRILTKAYQKVEYHQERYQQYNIINTYINTITAQITLQRPLKVVIDCGNGVAGKLITPLFTALGCKVIELFCEVDGSFPNHHPDPSVSSNLQDLINTVITEHADVGIAFDGDADRIGVVTNSGKIIYPDRLLILFARDILSRHPGARILFDVKCTENLTQVIQAHGGEAIMCPTGHSIIKTQMQQTKALLAGEMSGHIFFKENWYGFDDGLYTACRLLNILATQQLTADELFATVPDSINTPELKIPLADELKFNFMDRLKAEANFNDGVINTLDGVRVAFKNGWGLVRASNTTPNLVARFEAKDDLSLQQIQHIFKIQLLKINFQLQLPF